MGWEHTSAVLVWGAGYHLLVGSQTGERGRGVRSSCGGRAEIFLPVWNFLVDQIPIVDQIPVVDQIPIAND